VNFRIVNIIQARMGSSRLPGKMAKLINHRAMIDWVLCRTLSSGYETVLATTNNKVDDQLSDFCRQKGISCYRGDENDVLLRYVNAAKMSKADIVIRVCGDRPFVDPSSIRSAVELFMDSDSDVVFNHYPHNSNIPIGFGAEVFSFKFLECLNLSVLSEYEREHVTLHAYQNSENFKLIQDTSLCKYVENDLIKLDVDTEQDLERARALAGFIGIDSTVEEIISAYKGLKI